MITNNVIETKNCYRNFLTIESSHEQNDSILFRIAKSVLVA